MSEEQSIPTIPSSASEHSQAIAPSTDGDLFVVRTYPVVTPKLARRDDAEGHEGHD